MRGIRNLALSVVYRRGVLRYNRRDTGPVSRSHTRNLSPNAAWKSLESSKSFPKDFQN